jgi:RNA polymerase sigma factor (sigma-70 family)
MNPEKLQEIQELIEGCKRNDSKSQRAVFFAFSESLFATCLRYVGDEDAAKDVLQESFISIFKYIKTYDDSKGSFLNWLRKICIHQSLKYIKSRYTIVDFYEQDPVDVVNTEPGPEEMLVIQELFDQIIKLPEPYRTVFNLYEIEGYSHNEIAELLQIKTGSSRSILSRAKKILLNYYTQFQLKST